MRETDDYEDAMSVHDWKKIAAHLVDRWIVAVSKENFDNVGPPSVGDVEFFLRRRGWVPQDSEGVWWCRGSGKVTLPDDPATTIEELASYYGVSVDAMERRILNGRLFEEPPAVEEPPAGKVSP